MFLSPFVNANFELSVSHRQTLRKIHDSKEMKESFYTRCDPAADLWVTGEDAAEFLQGQFTNDLHSSETFAITYGLWLNQKGRVLADSFIWQESASVFRVMSEWSRAATVRERLEAYIIADDVAIDDRTEGSAGWILGGPDAPGWITRLGFAVPPAATFARAGEALLFRSRLGGRESWRLHVPRAAAATWNKMIEEVGGAGCRVENDSIAIRRIAAGVPVIPDELGSGDLPNEGGLEHEAISYTKGCYLGQEVMSRLKNLGRVRRRLYVVRGSAAAALPVIGSELRSDEHRVGELRAVQRHEGGWVGFAMLQTGHVTTGQTLRLEDSEAASVVIDRLAEGRAW